MNLLLTIDTATETGSISLSADGLVIEERLNLQQKDHASWIHTAIKEMFSPTNFTLRDLKYIAVVAGPGSYTGLRVGMATAKGLCYALNIPMVTLNTLELMAEAAIERGTYHPSTLFCPMLDARRMEVFTALYDTSRKPVLDPCAMVLEEDSFNFWLKNHPILFFGGGSIKWEPMVKNLGASFALLYYTPSIVARIGNTRAGEESFTEIAYSEPFYLKDFYNNQKQ